MEVDQALKGSNGGSPQMQYLQGTDLEVAHNLQGAISFSGSTRLASWCFAQCCERRCRSCWKAGCWTSTAAPDLVFTIGDSEEGLLRMLRAAGLDQAPSRRGLLA
jgi:hypothetical protein